MARAEGPYRRPMIVTGRGRPQAPGRRMKNTDAGASGGQVDQETMTGFVRRRKDGPVTRVTLMRPDKLNALDASIVEDLHAAVSQAAGDGTRLLVFQGEGKGFSAGFDVADLDRQSDGDLALRFVRIEMLLQAVRSAPFVTAAFVHGICFGAAADLAAVCVHRIAAPATRFRMPGLRFGIVLGTRRLAGLVGRDAARAILTGSKIFDADEALRIGFVTEIRDGQAWPERVVQLTEFAEALPAASLEHLLRITGEEADDADLADLARSAAAPGLKQRIQAYVARSK